MRAAWDRRAEADALTSIESSRRDWTSEEFLAHGRGMVAQAMVWVGDGVQRGSMLEIGCGVGRTALAFAESFDVVEGVDISPRMIERAVESGLPENVRLRTNSGESLDLFDDASLDLVFSEHVFQHIADETVIGRYLGDIGRVLKPGGAALLQFDTRPRGLDTLLYRAVPSRLLARERREFMRRYRRDQTWVRKTAEAAGLAVDGSVGRAATGTGSCCVQGRARTGRRSAARRPDAR